MGWLNKIFGGSSQEEQPIDAEVETEAKEISRKGFFSTDEIEYRGKITNQVINEMSFKEVPTIPQVAYAMDGKESNITVAMDSQTLKSAFTVSQRIPENLFAWYVSQAFIGYQACAFIAQNWLVDKACTVPAQDAVRKGWKITINDGSEVDQEVMTKIRKLDKKYKVKKNLVELEKFNRVFGIRIAYFQVESPDKDYYKKPFNIDGVRKGSYKGIVQIDPYWITPLLDADASGNPASQDFYEPTWWQVNGEPMHRSHLIVVRYSDVADILKPSYSYGGLPLTQLIWERAYAAERTANEAPQLAMTKRTTGLYVDMEAAIANEKLMEEKMEFWAQYRDNYGIKLLGQEERMEQFDTALSDLDAVIMSQYQIVAGIANVPVTKLMGTTPKGFNSTGDYEIDSYIEELETIQCDTLEPMLERHYELLLKSEGLNFEVDIEWNSLKVESEQEVSTRRNQDSQTAVNYASIGAIDGFDARKKISEDPDSGFSGLEVDDFNEEETDTEVNEEEIGLNPGEKNKAKPQANSADQMDLFAMDGVKNGYIEVKPRARDAQKLYGAALLAGISDPIDIDKMHVTIMRSAEPIENASWNYSPLMAKPTGEIRVMGEGKYRAICIMLDSEDLHKRHEEIRMMGGVARFPDYLPHISLKYGPTDADIAAIENLQMPIDSMILEREEWKDTKD